MFRDRKLDPNTFDIFQTWNIAINLSVRLCFPYQNIKYSVKRNKNLESSDFTFHSFQKYNTDSKLTKVEYFSMDVCDFFTHIKDAMKLKIVISFEQIDM